MANLDINFDNFTKEDCVKFKNFMQKRIAVGNNSIANKLSILQNVSPCNVHSEMFKEHLKTIKSRTWSEWTEEDMAISSAYTDYMNECVANFEDKITEAPCSKRFDCQPHCYDVQNYGCSVCGTFYVHNANIV